MNSLFPLKTNFLIEEEIMYRLFLVMIFCNCIWTVNANAYLNKLACSLILPASTFGQAQVLSEPDIKKHFRLSSDWSIDPTLITTSEHKLIDTVSITPPEFDSSKHKVIVVFNPNAALWQDMLPEMLSWAKDLKAKVVGFNYRGVGLSNSYPKNSLDLVADGIEVVEYTKTQTQAPMVLYGRSLGGSIASYVANHMYKKGSCPKLFVDRSFRKLSSAAYHLIQRVQQQGRDSKTCNGFLFSIAPIPSLAKLGIKLSRWTLNTEKQFLAIPKSNRLAIYANNDEMFAFNQNLCSALPKDEQEWLFIGSHNQSLSTIKHYKIAGLSGTDLFYNFVLNN